MSKRVFEMGGKQYKSMLEIARELGLKRVYPKDFDKYGIVEVAGDTVKDTVEDFENEVKSLSISEFKSFVKPFSLETLETLLSKVSNDSWGHLKNDSIRRMRVIMSLKKHYYPDEVTAGKDKPAKSSGWKQFESDKLIKFADSQNIAYKKNDNEAILRMQVIMSLKKAGFSPETLVGKF